MPRPPYPDPVAPTRSSPLYEAPGGARCGDTFRETIEVRSPYGDVDLFVQELPRLWHMESLDIPLPFTSLEDRIAAGIADTTVVLDDYVESGEVDQNNYDAIDEHLDVASEYLDYCMALREHWASQSAEYVDSGDTPPEEARLWLLLPLREDGPQSFNRCWQTPGGEKIRLEKEGGGWVEFICPTVELRQEYAEDWLRYKDTLVKAAKQARCAQEGLYALVTYNKNRRVAEERPVAPPPRPPDPGETLRPAPPPLSRVPSPELPPPPPAAPGWSTGKKVAVAGLVAVGAGVAYWLATRGDPVPARVTNWTYPEVT